jgi:NAD-dependent dihydropyrimidine dehydrogenase PreA subunit
MWVITIDTAKCEGDGDCANICPVTILAVQELDGKQVSQVTGSPDDCIGCMSCVTECKQEAITVVEM